MRASLTDRVRSVVGDRECVIALGGGADSAVLLAAAADGVGTENVRGVFVYHGLEGSDSLREAVKMLTDRLDVRLSVVEAVVPDGADLETRTRAARYDALAGTLASGEVCCTAHTHDDQAETVLMRLMRGSGPTGMSGIPSVREPFARPFLDVRRSELREVAQAEGLPFVDDPANDDARFLRSRLRGDLIPLIEESYAPAFRENVVRVGKLIAADDEALTAQSDHIPVRVADGEVAIPTAPLLTAPHPLASRSVRRALGAFHDPYHGSHDDVGSVMNTATDGVARTLSGDIACVLENAEVVLTRKQVVMAEEPVPVTVGERFTWYSDTYVTSVSMVPSLRTTVGRRTAIRLPTESESLIVRGVRDGDRIDIESGSTPVVEVLRVAGVPARIRPFWTVVTIGAKIAALHGIKVAPWAKPIGGEPAVIIEREDAT